MKLMFWKKKPPPPPPPPKLPKQSKITVVLTDGTIITHWARYRSIRPDGRLTLHDNEKGGNVVAEYAPGFWGAMSAGKRAVRPPLFKGGSYG